MTEIILICLSSRMNFSHSIYLHIVGDAGKEALLAPVIPHWIGLDIFSFSQHLSHFNFRYPSVKSTSPGCEEVLKVRADHL